MEMTGLDIGGVGLPSKGLVYEVKLENIKIRTMKFGDQKILSSMNFDNVEKKYIALLSLVVSGIDVNKLTLGDRDFILLWERANSYSPKFQIQTVCQCCMQNIEAEIDLTEINSKELPSDFKEPYQIILSDKQILNLRLLRVVDEAKTLDWERKSGPDNAFMYKWATTIVNDKDIVERINYLDKLSPNDGQKIKDFHEVDFKHGPESDNVSYKCPKCGEADQKMVLPFLPDFLIPRNRRFS